jgi:hypothetical protein
MHRGKLVFHQPVDVLLESTKRIRAIVATDVEKLNPPPGTVWQRRNGREWLVTMKEFSSAQVEFLRTSNPVENIEVLDVTLDDIFRDYVRGLSEVDEGAP